MDDTPTHRFLCWHVVPRVSLNGSPRKRFAACQVARGRPRHEKDLKPRLPRLLGATKVSDEIVRVGQISADIFSAPRLWSDDTDDETHQKCVFHTDVGGVPREVRMAQFPRQEVRNAFRIGTERA